MSVLAFQPLRPFFFHKVEAIPEPVEFSTETLPLVLSLALEGGREGWLRDLAFLSGQMASVISEKLHDSVEVGDVLALGLCDVVNPVGRELGNDGCNGS